jgi:hypothetical protein
VAGVISLAAVLGDSIPFTTHMIAKKNAAARVRQQVRSPSSRRRTVDSRPRSR